MKWILTLLIGALGGAGALLYVLSTTPYPAHWPYAPAVAAAPVVETLSTPPMPALTPVAPVGDWTSAGLQGPVALPPGNPMNTVVLPVQGVAAGTMPGTVPGNITVTAPTPATNPSAPAASTTASTPPASVAPQVAASATVAPPAPPLPSGASDGKTFGKLIVPVAGIKAAQLSDTFNQMRGSDRRHEAIDIMAPTGTKVFAVADGKVTKLFNSKQGGLTMYQFDTSERFSYYYAHLDQYAYGLVEGMQLKQGDLIGYVGSTGNASPTAPHLHFAIYLLTPEKQWWTGTPINPYPVFKE